MGSILGGKKRKGKERKGKERKRKERHRGFIELINKELFLSYGGHEKVESALI